MRKGLRYDNLRIFKLFCDRRKGRETRSFTFCWRAALMSTWRTARVVRPSSTPAKSAATTSCASSSTTTTSSPTLRTVWVRWSLVACLFLCIFVVYSLPTCCLHVFVAYRLLCFHFFVTSLEPLIDFLHLSTYVLSCTELTSVA